MIRLLPLLGLLVTLAWGDIYLVDGDRSVKLAKAGSPSFDPEALEALPHVKRHAPTLTLRFEGEGYNHRHLNVRLATLSTHPVYTVLTEYSEAQGAGAYTVTFGGYRFYEALMLQVFYQGKWYLLMLDPLEHE